MDSFDLLQKLDREHGKKSDYKTTVNIEDINKVTAERISSNKLKPVPSGFCSGEDT